MAKRISGSLTVWLNFSGHVDDLGRGEYNGFIHIPGKGNWHFSGIFVGAEVKLGSPEAYDAAAETAINVGGFYCTGNRDGEIPDWAPDAEVADAIHDGHDYVPESIPRGLARLPDVHVGELAVIFRTNQAQEVFWAHMESLAKSQRRGHLRVISGGLSAA